MLMQLSPIFIKVIKYIMNKEKALIKKYFVPLSRNSESLNLSNDGAVIKKSSDLVVTSDMMIENIHFDSLINPKFLAKKILRVNLSDLASMGSSPYGYILNLGLPQTFGHEWLKNFCLGLKQDQIKYDLKLFGGDLSSSKKIFLSVTMIGKIKKSFLKSVSKKKSDIFVTGNLGDSALGFFFDKQKNFNINDKLLNYFRKKHIMPNPRLKIGKDLVGYAEACRDISDGLIEDLSNICQQSKLKANIFLDKIPLSKSAKIAKKQVENTINFWELVLTFGEDYELIFAMDKIKQNSFFKKNKFLSTKVTNIGFLSKGSGVEVRDRENKIINFSKFGFSHF